MAEETKENELQLQFCPWLITKISSGKYPGLEWIDGTEQKVFRIPWTKVNYPMWEEHHQIFKAWAVHRGKRLKESGELEQSFSQVKSNFRTILRKCVEIEEMEEAHRLGLQTGNYKVYRILSSEESHEKRKSQQEIRKAYKLGKIVDGRTRRCRKRVVNPSVGKQRTKLYEMTLEKLRAEASIVLPNASKILNICTATTQTTSQLITITTNTTTQSTQTSNEDFPNGDITNTFLLEPAAFEETIDTEEETNASTMAEYITCNLHNSVSTQFESQSQTEAMDIKKAKVIYNTDDAMKENVKDDASTKKAIFSVDGFQMLLQAAELTGDQRLPCNGMKSILTTKPSKPAVKTAFTSIVDVLVELKIPPEELFTYEMHVRYQTRNVMNDAVLNDMSYGYRIRYGKKDQKHLIPRSTSENLNLHASFAHTPITLPPSSVPPGNSLYSVLKDLESGLVVQSDSSYTLHAKRLCLGCIYAFTKYGDTDADVEPLLIPREKEVVLFSYKKFLLDWHHFLINGSPRPNHEINLAFGKKPKHRHSRVFVAVRLVPKAAETMLRKLGTIDEELYSNDCDLQDSTLDNVLRLFNVEQL